MFSVICLVISACLFKCTTGFTFTECETVGNTYQNLEVVEQMIKSAKEKFSYSIHSSLPLDCADLFNNGVKTSGVYLVWPRNRIISGSIFVYCDMETDGGGWTVIQRRGNFNRSKDYFYQDWKAYKEGFGDLKEDFWLGNDNIYALSNQKLYTARFDLGDFQGSKRYAVYDKFWIDNEESNYTLHYIGYKGNAGDSLLIHNGCKFTTKDRDNDEAEGKCAVVYKGAWWYRKCYSSSLNGEYYVDKSVEKGHGLIWATWKGSNESLATTEIKIRNSPSWIK